MAILTHKDRAILQSHVQVALMTIRKYDKHIEPYDEIDNLDHHLRLVEALLENN